MSKFPEDLRVYEHLLWESRADVVIELGTQWGGSALWFRDRLRTMESYGRIGRGRVVSVDLSTAPAAELLSASDPTFSEQITLLDGDVRDPALPARIRACVPAEGRCLVVEDAAHNFETTLAALRGFGEFVALGGYFIVEDGCVDIEEMRLEDDWPRGVLPAIEEWLDSLAGSRFVVRRDLECYGISCHPRGFLQRVA